MAASENYSSQKLVELTGRSGEKLSNTYDKTMQDLLDRRVDWLVCWSTQ